MWRRLWIWEPFALVVKRVVRIVRESVWTRSLFSEPLLFPDQASSPMQWATSSMWVLGWLRSEGKIPSFGSLVDCHFAINAHVSRERLTRHDLWFPSDTCKGYCSTWVPITCRVFLVCVSKVSSVPLIWSWSLENRYEWSEPLDGWLDLIRTGGTLFEWRVACEELYRIGASRPLGGFTKWV